MKIINLVISGLICLILMSNYVYGDEISDSYDQDMDTCDAEHARQSDANLAEQKKCTAGCGSIPDLIKQSDCSNVCNGKWLDGLKLISDTYSQCINQADKRLDDARQQERLEEQRLEEERQQELEVEPIEPTTTSPEETPMEYSNADDFRLTHINLYINIYNTGIEKKNDGNVDITARGENLKQLIQNPDYYDILSPVWVSEAIKNIENKVKISPVELKPNSKVLKVNQKVATDGLGNVIDSDEEIIISGKITKRINRNDPEFNKFLWYNKPNIIFKNEEKTDADRMMTPELAKKLDKLSFLAKSEFPDMMVIVTEAWDEDGEHSKNSLHYEGRAVDITIGTPCDIAKTCQYGYSPVTKKLGRLGQLAIDAGFEWVWYENELHVHASVKKASQEIQIAPQSTGFSLEGVLNYIRGLLNILQRNSTSLNLNIRRNGVSF